MNPLHDKRLLLLQARDEKDMLEQERLCFEERCRVPLGQFRIVNVVEGTLSASALDGMDAVLIGGSGAYSAWKDYAWMPVVLDLLRLVHQRRIPTFGSCWGHQVIARALGGEVKHDPERAELGCGSVTLTAEGREDVLFSDFPNTFFANMGHHDRVVALPPGAVELAYNASQRNQAFRMSDAPIYGTQFHSELDARRERERLLVYREFYAEQFETEADFQAIIDGLAETTQVDDLMHHFLVAFT
jgi:GMP synthase (glutamine-hydrolysing)